MPSKRASLKSAKFGFADPLGRNFKEPTRHVIPDSSLARTIGPGDTIWVISQLSMTDREGTAWLPPALDARVEINDVPKSSSEGLVAVPVEGSRWFPLADGTGLLSQLQSIRSTGLIASLQVSSGQAIGRQFQGIRRLVDGIAIERWAALLSAAPIDFISYRQVDGTRAAFHIAARLLKQGSVVFWDRWSLPRGLVERREQLPGAPLDDVLRKALESATNVWGIETPKYGEIGSYSRKEADIAQVQGTYRQFVDW